MIKVKRAIISVSDKKGLVDFAKGLHRLGVEILSTGGTARHLKEAGLPVIDVSDYTGLPEMLDGRIKTLHPRIHGGLLALRENPQHLEEIKKYNYGLIDMAVVNLYPFESVIRKKKVSLEEALENIDIGGPAMLRSAAKNFKNVAVICNPQRYLEIRKELETNNGLLSDAVLFHLAIEAFQHTSRYDSIIYEFLNKRLRSEEFTSFPNEISLKFLKVQDLRYGENPHQRGAFYRDAEESSGLAVMKQWHGKELSFNNILDLNAAVDFVQDFNDPAAVIIKHTNPTGICEDKILSRALQQALSCDPVSAFGGIIGLNRKVDAATAKLTVKSGFMECLIAPAYENEALEILKQKKNLRVMQMDLGKLKRNGLDFKRIHGGVLLQEWDEREPNLENFKVVTKKKPTKAQMESLLFGWKIIKHIKSNAIILVKDKRTVGIGCGQTSRIESIQAAVQKAAKMARNSCLISEAFLPKTDNVALASKAGVKAIIQTGGSIADPDVIKFADKAGIAMITTGVRHFKH